MDLSVPSAETVTRVELANGLTLLVRENQSSPSVVVGGYLWAGSAGETPQQAGLSAFAAGMLMRGTQRWTFAQINERLESVGARLGFYSSVHTTSFGGKALSEDLDLLLDVLADAVQHPAFPPAEVETLRGQILTALQRRAHDTAQMADLAANELLYPDHPYGRSVQGYEHTVQALRRDDLLRFYRDHYAPRGMVLAVVGAVQASSVVQKVEAALGGWLAPGATPDRSVPAEVRLAEQRRTEVLIPGKTQADIVLGWPGLARSDPNYMAAKLANTVLGVFGIMGRLGDNVRDNQGLAYYVYSQLQAGLGAGPWLASAGVDPAHVERAVDAILGEVRRLRDEPVPAEELADCQSYLIGTMPLRLETNEGVANALVDIERYGLGPDYLLSYGDLVRAVTAEAVQATVRRYLDPDHYVLAVAGLRP